MITVYKHTHRTYDDDKNEKIETLKNGYSVVEQLARNGYQKITVINKGFGTCSKTGLFGSSIPGYYFRY